MNPAISTPPPPAEPRPFQFPRFTQRTLANGLTLIVVEDTRLPLVAYSMQMRAGKADVPPARSGLAWLSAALLREGAAGRTSQEISRLVDRAGGRLNSSAGEDFTSISATFLKQHAPLGLSLLTGMVRRPDFPEQEVARLVQQQQSSLAVQYNDAEYLLPLAAARAVFGEHPYGYPGDGTPRSLASLTRDAIVDYHRRRFKPARAWLAIAGDVTASEAFAAAENAFGDWAGVPEDLAPPAAPPAPRAQVLLIDNPGATQSHISVGHLGFPRMNPDFLTIQVANQIFGGSFNSRVNLKLRAAEGLTYGAGSSFRSYRHSGLFRAGTFTRTEKTAAAVGMLVELIREWKENPATPAELAEAKAFMAGSFAVDLETAGAVASRVLTQSVFGLPEDYFPNYRENVQAITLEQVCEAVRRVVQPDRLTIAVAGDAAAFQAELARYGPVNVIPMGSLDLIEPTLRRQPAAS
ncbi:MAG: insulinase family protein [Bryobacteraceae bacterium]|nr:insulinase family protein [Bryobacteraceae bacterium]